MNRYQTFCEKRYFHVTDSTEIDIQNFILHFTIAKLFYVDKSYAVSSRLSMDDS